MEARDCVRSWFMISDITIDHSGALSKAQPAGPPKMGQTGLMSTEGLGVLSKGRTVQQNEVITEHQPGVQGSRMDCDCLPDRISGAAGSRTKVKSRQ